MRISTIALCALVCCTEIILPGVLIGYVWFAEGTITPAAMIRVIEHFFDARETYIGGIWASLGAHNPHVLATITTWTLDITVGIAGFILLRRMHRARKELFARFDKRRLANA